RAVPGHRRRRRDARTRARPAHRRARARPRRLRACRPRGRARDPGSGARAGQVGVPGALRVKTPRVAYVLRAFPRLSETFILHELRALQARGIPVRVFALERVEASLMHPEAEALLPEVTFVTPRDPIAWRGPRIVPAEQRKHAAAGRRIGRELRAWGATH